jgi:AcrR family transcriptional regulator
MDGASAATSPGPGRTDVRERIVREAAALVARGGREALTTRAVAAAAGVQAPTIYRIFGDKSGLIDAVAEHGFASYLGEKGRRDPGPDPVEDLRTGWDLHVGFGLANPALYSLMYGDPQPGRTSSAAAAGHRVLEEHIARIARAGRLRVPEATAAHLVHAGGSGTVFALLALDEDERDPRLSDLAREAVIAAISTDAPVASAGGVAPAAIALHAALGGDGDGDGDAVLTAGERTLLGEWLRRLGAG